MVPVLGSHQVFHKERSPSDFSVLILSELDQSNKAVSVRVGMFEAKSKRAPSTQCKFVTFHIHSEDQEKLLSHAQSTTSHSSIPMRDTL